MNVERKADLSERTRAFARQVIRLDSVLPKTTVASIKTVKRRCGR